MPLLLERQAELQRLTECWRALDAPGASGHTVVVQAEAGAGKTALADSFVSACDGEHWACSFEPALAPEPLAALRALPLPDELSAALRPRAERDAAWLARWLRLLRDRPRPLLWVMDDLHWADTASLELLRFIARRIGGLRLMLVLLARSDTLPAGHPMHGLLGVLPPAHSTRLRLAPLSTAAVRALAAAAGRAHEAEPLYAATGGNPLLVSEAIAAPAGLVSAALVD